MIKNQDGSMGCNLLTRREVIDNWQKSKHLNRFCCPNCRDLLHNYKHDSDKKGKTQTGISIGLYCHNEGCSLYNKELRNMS